MPNKCLPRERMTIMPEIFGSFWFVLFASITITSVVATVAQAWQKVRRTEQEAVLKQEMLQRGLSVEEMERLLHTTSTGPRAAVKLPPAADGDDGAIEELAECLGECQASAPVIENLPPSSRVSPAALSDRSRQR